MNASRSLRLGSISNRAKIPNKTQNGSDCEFPAEYNQLSVREMVNPATKVPTKILISEFRVLRHDRIPFIAVKNIQEKKTPAPKIPICKLNPR
jgi:hypothetical protein